MVESPLVESEIISTGNTGASRARPVACWGGAAGSDVARGAGAGGSVGAGANSVGGAVGSGDGACAQAPVDSRVPRSAMASRFTAVP
jgi:hypothetical protein